MSVMKIKINIIITTAILLFANLLNAQVNLATIKGVVYNAEDSTEVVPFAKVWVETESGDRYSIADEAGRYSIDALKPGTYNLNVRSLGFDNLTITAIALNPSGIVKVNAYCGMNGVLPPVEIYVPLLIPGDIPKIEIRLEDIEHSPYMRDPATLITKINSDVQMIEGTSDLIIRGSRPGDAIYYIDGIKMNSMSSVPGAAIGGLEAYTGGIPAKYGDTTGGVIVLETKSYFDLYAAWKYSQ
ncbi:MAG: TonB-dependent receptor plug domain-containing protein [Crocinitomix sp.]|nr:TonB-dependent receptor plug domain-containing protein [Crocinitomix sp.]